jgi:hypothetical protein
MLRAEEQLRQRAEPVEIAQAEVARRRDEAAQEHNALMDSSIGAGQVMRGSGGLRADVRQLEEALRRLEAAL